MSFFVNELVLKSHHSLAVAYYRPASRVIIRVVAVRKFTTDDIERVEKAFEIPGLELSQKGGQMASVQNFFWLGCLEVEGSDE